MTTPTCRREREARFWVYVNGGPVKLTLYPGQRLRHGAGRRATMRAGPQWTRTWEYQNGIVSRSWCNDGRDCDGRLTRYGQDQCPLDRLQEREPCAEGSLPGTFDGVLWPDWQETDAGQRDEYAELAGY